MVSSQGYWLGMGALLQRIARKKIPGCSMLGHLGAHWTTKAGLDRFSSELFKKQVEVMTILTERLMQVM